MFGELNYICEEGQADYRLQIAPKRNKIKPSVEVWKSL